MKKLLTSFMFVCLLFCAFNAVQAWMPKLNFDIEGHGFIKSMIFISGYDYALNATNSELKKRGMKNFYCHSGLISSKTLIDILNNKLLGVVSAEDVDKAIRQGLVENYFCKKPDKVGAIKGNTKRPFVN